MAAVTDMLNTCPACGAEESLESLLARMIDDDRVRRLIASIITTSLPVGGAVVRYLRLHKPAKQRLRMEKVASLLTELVTDIASERIERRGRIWQAPIQHWKDALQAVFEMQAAGKLTLPLTNNALLYEVLMRKADEAEGKAEQQAMDELRTRGRIPEGEPLPLAVDPLKALDPALQKIVKDGASSVPMPEAARKLLAELRGGKAASEEPTP